MHQFHWSHNVRQESLFASGANSRGVDITANASSNTKGSWVTGAAAGFAWEYMIAGFQRNASADYTVDIGIGSGGSEWVLAADLRVPGQKNSQEATVWYPLALHVPAGATLTARCQSSIGSSAVSMILTGFSSGPNGLPGYSRLIALYAPSNSRGVTVDPGGTANTKVRTEIVASSAQRVTGLLFQVGHNADVTRAAAATAEFDIETGAASSERLLCGGVCINWSTVLDGPLGFSWPEIPCDVRAGERFSANMRCSIATAGDRTIDLALWGLVP